jgi:hypothetical protein
MPDPYSQLDPAYQQLIADFDVMAMQMNEGVASASTPENQMIVEAAYPAMAVKLRTSENICGVMLLIRIGDEVEWLVLVPPHECMEELRP